MAKTEATTLGGETETRLVAMETRVANQAAQITTLEWFVADLLELIETHVQSPIEYPEASNALYRRVIALTAIKAKSDAEALAEQAELDRVAAADKAFQEELAQRRADSLRLEAKNRLNAVRADAERLGVS